MDDRRELNEKDTWDSLLSDHQREGHGVETFSDTDDLLEPSDEHPFLSSATDLLISWLPRQEHSGSAFESAAAWDRYFGGAAARRRSVSHRARSRLQPAEAIEPPAVFSLQQEELEAAEEAVDCLFRFLHALERCDVRGAMSCVSADYHVVERNREIGRKELELDLENLMDRWRGREVHISTTEVPDPVLHPLGVLILATIQIDFVSTADERLTSELVSRMCVFTRGERGEWLLSSMAHAAWAQR